MRARRGLGWVVAGALFLAGCGAPDPSAVTAPPTPTEAFFAHFAAGSSRLGSPSAYFSLGYVVALLHQDPRLCVLVIGHADPQGGPDFNRALSFRRARSVRAELLGHGIAAKRILVAAPAEKSVERDPLLIRRADIYLFDPVHEEASHRLGYRVEIRAE